MEFPVMLHENKVGTCTLMDGGLYWQLHCRCDLVSDRVERLYVGERKLGVLEKEADELTMKRSVSKASCPELPPEHGYFTLYPEVKQEPEPEKTTEEVLTEVEVHGHKLKGRLEENCLIFPYDQGQPCPCEPLLCFFEVRDGYWRLPLPTPELEAETEEEEHHT